MKKQTAKRSPSGGEPKIENEEKKEKYLFGDISIDIKDETEQMQEQVMDDLLAKADLTRKKIPKDGACLFRAVSDQLFYTQSQHLRVRKECVDYIELHKDEYEPFTCVSGLPFDHYCFQMRKLNTWGGQLELHALSMTYRVNFTIYSAQYKEPTKVDNGFSRNILLCYYGNHYDSVVKKSSFQIEVFCQGLVYEIINTVLGLPKDRSKPHDYKNVGWDFWVHHLKEQEREDEILAQKMLTESIIKLPSYAELTGYYKKKSLSPQTTSKWQNPLTPGRINKPNEWFSQLPKQELDAETLELLKEVSAFEEQEKLKALQDRDTLQFPSLPGMSSPKPKENGTEEKPNQWGGKNWKEVLQSKPNVMDYKAIYAKLPPITFTTYYLKSLFEAVESDATPIVFGSVDSPTIETV